MTKKTVLITGCSSGFGRLTAELLARRGLSVFASLREPQGRNADAANELSTRATQEGLALEVVELDVTADASVTRAAEVVLARAGRIDVLINNAGLLGFGPTEAFRAEQVRALFEVNCFGAHRLARAVLPAMRQRGSGLIVQVTSSLARCPLPYFGVYCASKAALESLSESMAEELLGSGVEVALVEPGPYPTGIAAHIVAPDDADRAAAYDLTREQLVGECFREISTGPGAGNPCEVAEAIARLIELPAGRRPLRTVLGPATRETVRWNEAAAQFQERVRLELGLPGEAEKAS